MPYGTILLVAAAFALWFDLLQARRRREHVKLYHVVSAGVLVAIAIVRVAERMVNGTL